MWILDWLHWWLDTPCLPAGWLSDWLSGRFTGCILSFSLSSASISASLSPKHCDTSKQWYFRCLLRLACITWYYIAHSRLFQFLVFSFHPMLSSSVCEQFVYSSCLWLSGWTTDSLSGWLDTFCLLTGWLTGRLTDKLSGLLVSSLPFFLFSFLPLYHLRLSLPWLLWRKQAVVPPMPS